MYNGIAYQVDILHMVGGKEYRVCTTISQSMTANMHDQGVKDILRYSFEQMLSKMENELGTLRE